MNPERYTLITGAGKGFGKALARECAGRGFNLLLTALPGEGLASFAASLQKDFKIKTDFLETDLTEKGAVQKVYRWVHDHHYTLNRLINNAGLGSVGPFTSQEADFYAKQLDLNVKVTVLMSRLFVEELAREPESRILNISSMASFFSMPYKAVYSSSKRFINNFSMALRGEYIHTSLRVSVACPEPLITNELVLQRINDQGWLGRKVAMKPEEAARKCIRGLLKGKTMILPGTASKIAFMLEKIIPQPLKVKLVSKLFHDNPPS